MSRTFDQKLSVSNVSGVSSGSVVISNNNAKGVVTAIVDNNVYVRLFDTNIEFESNTPLQTTSNVTITSIRSVARNKILKEKNVFVQTPVVRLFSIYYPGEWYQAGSVVSATGKAWPQPFPLRLATIHENVRDENYTVLHNGLEYLPIGIDISNISESTDGSINEFSATILDAKNIIADLIEDPYIAGYSEGNFVSNTGIDIRTIPGNPAYSQNIVNEYGGATNVAMTKQQSDSLGNRWVEVKEDSRDLLGAVVEIRSTFAKFLDYWPEYDLIQSISGNTITVNDGSIYRVGDNVTSNTSSSVGKITSISEGFNTIRLDTAITANIGDRLYIVNEDADPESFIEDTAKINSLDSFAESQATFTLNNFVDYFNNTIPRRKYYPNACSFKYRDNASCGYSGTSYFNLQNQSTDAAGDQCAKTLEACQLRRNQRRFGGFVGVRR